jgi:hypothetical protein
MAHSKRGRACFAVSQSILLFLNPCWRTLEVEVDNNLARRWHFLKQIQNSEKNQYFPTFDPPSPPRQEGGTLVSLISPRP